MKLFHVISLLYRLAALAARRGEGKMPSPSFTLDAQLRFHDKWLKIDLQVFKKIYYDIDHFHMLLLLNSWLFFASQKNCIVELLGEAIISQVVVGLSVLHYYWGPN